jgi:hypothetical protein
VSSYEEAQSICQRLKLNLVSIDNNNLQTELFKSITEKLKEKGMIFKALKFSTTLDLLLKAFQISLLGRRCGEMSFCQRLCIGSLGLSVQQRSTSPT